jgi:spermidine synthase
MSVTTAAPPPIAAVGRKRTQLEIGLLFVASGASGLMLEVVWSRMLGWLLGATTWSVMTILVVFMGGLGLGGIVWGRRASRSARPLRLFGWMEVVIGLYSLAVPLLFEGLGRAFVLASQVVGDSPGATMAVRVAMAVLTLAPPTFLMGGTLPVLTRFAASGGAEPGRIAGRLYAANTAGAVVGCFVAGCWLIFHLGVIETNLLAAALDLGVGLAALFWDRGNAALPGDGHAEDEPAGPRASVAVSTALLIATVSGFCGMAYEVLWSRSLLAAITDDTTYAFTLMLSAFLAGHALGAALAGRTTPRTGAAATDRAWQGWRQLGRSQVLAAAFALLSLPLLVVVRDPINRLSFVEAMTFWTGRIPFHLALSLAVFAPAAAFLGASFAIAARLYVGLGRPVAASTGRLYGLNTMGAIAGAIVTTAWLIPSLGAQGSIVLLAVVQAIIGALAFLLLGGPASSWARRIGVAAAWTLPIAVGCALNREFPLADLYARQEPGKLLALIEGSGAAITVHQRKPNDRVISINGTNVAGTNPILRATQKLQAHLPVCLHPSPRAVLQIGFGSGGTCYSVSLHPEVESIEVVELNPDVLKVASTWFEAINHGVLKDPRVRTRTADARGHVAVTDRTYDLILSDSTHPRFRGNAALYSRDYFEDCARRLRPGGILSTWLPLYGQSVEDIRGILKSMQSVFAHVQVWYPNTEPHENTIVIGSRQPIAIDPVEFERRIGAARVADDLATSGMDSTVQVLDFFLLGDRAVAEFSRSGRLSTDDHPRLEFLAPMSLRRHQSWINNFASVRLAREPIGPYLVNAGTDWRARLDRWYAGTTWKLAGQSDELEGRTGDALKSYAEGVRVNPEDLRAQLRLSLLRKALDPTEPAGSVPSTLP